MVSRIICALLVLFLCVHGYKLVHNYDHTNWYESFIFETVRVPSYPGSPPLTMYSCQTQPMASLSMSLWLTHRHLV